MIRTGTDNDGPRLIALIGSCWAAYPGLRMDVDGEMPELHALASYYAEQGGGLWVAEERGEVSGMIAVRPLDDAAPGDASWEICRVYVDPSHHGGGLAHALLTQAEQHAIAAGAGTLKLWTDTRFGRAHRFYEKRSYVRHGKLRILHDLSNSLEYGYAKPVNGAWVLDVAAAASAARGLGEILTGCVEAGVAVGFLAPLSPERASGFYRTVAANVGKGTATLVAAWCDGELAGAGVLDLDMPETQRHRADLMSLVVKAERRRGGVGRSIVQGLERQGRTLRRSLLTLAAPSGHPMEALCRQEAWQEAGRIPRYWQEADGSPEEAIIFWKALA